MPFVNTRLMINEATSLEVQINETGLVRVKEASRMDVKDRYMTLAMASLFADKIENKYVNDSDDNDIDFKYDKYRLFNFNEMTPDQKKRLIKKGLKEKDNEYFAIREDLRSAYEYIMDMLTDEKDLDIVDMLISGMTEAEIADEMGVKRQGINKRIKNIVEKKI